MQRASRSCKAALALAVALLGLAVAPATAGATPTPQVVYDAIPAAVPGNVPSQAFEATQTSEFGDLVRLAPGPRGLTAVTVMLSSWGCESGTWYGGDCATSNGATFPHDITVNLYSVDRSGGAPAPGALVATDTETFDIPYRPSADPTDCPSHPERWYSAADDACYNGLATPITFAFDGSTQLPSEVIWTVAFDTTHYGANPIGESAPCYSSSGGCGYDSLNVGLGADVPSVGSDEQPDSAFLDSTWSGAYCDGGSGGTGSLRDDTGCWTGYVPLAQIETVATSASTTTVTVNPSNTQGWGFYEETASGTGSFVAGPDTPPLGVGSARLQVDGTGREILGTFDYSGTRLDAITSLRYRSYRNSPDPGQDLSISLQFDTDYDVTDGNTSWQGRLVFEPYQTVGNTIADDQWNTWSPLDGVWWASGAPGSTVCPQGAPCDWLTLLNHFPNAGISGAVNLKAGGPWTGGFIGSVDGFSIGTDDGAGNLTKTVYDFEPDSLGSCPVALDTVNQVATLLADCTTDHTLLVPDGWTLDGDGYTITAVDPSGDHFRGAIVANAGTSMTVRDVTLRTQGLSDTCDAGTDRLRGVLFDGASGAARHVTVSLQQGSGDSGCQEGNAFEARNEPFDKTGVDTDVVFANDIAARYVKTGILANGSVSATIRDNTVTGSGHLGIGSAAQNGIQIGYGATATLTDNTVSDNYYDPTTYDACGLLLYKAGGVGASKPGLAFIRDDNDIHHNEQNICNYGKGGGFSGADA